MRSMSQPRQSPRTLPRIPEASTRPYAAADLKAAASLTEPYTGPAVLRRVYGPSPPGRATPKKNAWRSRPSATSQSPTRQDDVSRGQAHHLAPLDARDPAQKRYDADALRFLSAVEESQRTAIKFEERRRRVLLWRHAAPPDNLIAAPPDAPALYVEDSEEPRVSATAERGLERLVDGEEEAPTSVPTSASRLRPERERVAGDLVDAVLRSTRRRTPRETAPPYLVESEEELPVLRAAEAAEAEAVVDPDELRRLRRDAANALVNAWWESCPAPRQRQPLTSSDEVLPTLRAVSAELPRTPAKADDEGRWLYASEVDEGTDGLRRAREAEAQRWVSDAVSRQRERALPVLTSYAEETEREAPHKHLRSSEMELPRALQASEEERGMEEKEEEQGVAEDSDDLRRARRAEAALWAREAFKTEQPKAAPPATLYAEERDEGWESAPVLRAEEEASPQLTAYAEEYPRASMERAAAAKPLTHATGSDDGLRAARLRAAAGWVQDAFTAPRRRLSADRLFATEDKKSVEVDAAPLSTLEEEPARLIAHDTVPPRLIAHEEEDCAEETEEDAKSRGSSSGAAAMYPSETASVVPLRATADEAPQTQPREMARTSPARSQTKNDGLRRAREAEAEKWVGDAFEHPRRVAAIAEPMRSFEQEEERLAASESEPPREAPTMRGTLPTADLHALRRTVASTWVAAAFTALPNDTSSKQRNATHQNGANLEGVRESATPLRHDSFRVPASEGAPPQAAEEFHACSEENHLHSHETHYTPRNALHTSAVVTAASVQCERRVTPTADADLYAARRAVASSLVHGVCAGSFSVVAKNSAETQRETRLSLREARLREASRLVSAVM